MPYSILGPCFPLRLWHLCAICSRATILSPSQAAANNDRLRARRELTDALALHFVALEEMRDNDNDEGMIAHTIPTFQMPPNLPLPFPLDDDVVRRLVCVI